MENSKTEIIIKEIKYWKEHRLLPEHYCDFLLTLYTEGDESKQNTKNFSLKSMLFHFWIYFLIAQLPITFLVIYFTEMSYVLQMFLFLIFIVISIVSAWFLYKNNSKYVHIPMIVGALISFLVSVHFIGYTFPDQKLIMLFNILVNCILWIVLGIKMKMSYFVISGGIGAIILIFYYLF